jgi:ABC-type lipoprotein export system ATPase subunit
MIADAALLSQAPIILVDEIENAGIDRQVAVEFLVGRGKIALIATHDPLLALRADRRVIMRNGAMQAVIERSHEEEDALRWLEDHERILGRMRNDLRAGKRL